MSNDPVSVLTGKYLTLRKMKKDLADRQKDEMRPITEGMQLIENKLLKVMDEIGAQSVKTDFGTPYVSKQRTFVVVDFDAALPAMLENPDLIIRKVSKDLGDTILQP